MSDPNFAAKVKSEFQCASDFASLSPDLQSLFKQYFDRYDLNGNGILDSHKELTQIVTNLVFALKLGPSLSKLLEQVDVMGDSIKMDCPKFVEWFLAEAK